MEQIIQSIKNQNCIFWLGKHINAKNNTRLMDLAKDNGVFILNQEVLISGTFSRIRSSLNGNKITFTHFVPGSSQ